jgi:hypothetical protein
MASQAIIAADGTAKGLGSIQGSIAYLEQQPWWPGFRETRRLWAQQIDDVLWVGHFCGWLQRHGLAIERCTTADLDAYMASIASFRPAPRAACQRTVMALIDFLAAYPASPPIEGG